MLYGQGWDKGKMFCHGWWHDELLTLVNWFEVTMCKVSNNRRKLFFFNFTNLALYKAFGGFDSWQSKVLGSHNYFINVTRSPTDFLHSQDIFVPEIIKTASLQLQGSSKHFRQINAEKCIPCTGAKNLLLYEFSILLNCLCYTE